ncbi:pyrroline-5-carboxylate reductase [Corynebacterium diphtheriae]
MTSIAVIGGGKIGEALISGLVASVMSPKDIHVTNRNAERAQELKERYGVLTFLENIAAVDDVDMVFLCVKPQQVIPVVDEIADVVDNNTSTTIVSMAAGVTNAMIEESLAAGSPVIRVMPNTPMLVGKGMSVVAPGRYADEDTVASLTQLLEAVGSVEVIEESSMDAVVALSGSSPAYLFLMVEALIDAGVFLGLPRDKAKNLAVSSFAGAATMLEQTGEEPAVLRANVSSPGGTTIAAIREFEESGLRAAVYRAATAAATRNSSLG